MVTISTLMCNLKHIFKSLYLTNNKTSTCGHYQPRNSYFFIRKPSPLLMENWSYATSINRGEYGPFSKNIKFIAWSWPHVHIFKDHFQDFRSKNGSLLLFELSVYVYVCMWHFFEKFAHLFLFKGDTWRISVLNKIC